MKLHKMNDEECIAKFLEFLNERISLSSSFLIDDKDNITHQVLNIQCGEYVSVSEPEQLSIPMRLATAEEQGATIN